MLKDKLRGRKAADLRAERDELGFVRQPEVRWLSPGLLARSGIEVIVSGTFGKFADKREIQRESHDGMDYSATAGDVWVDYLSDTGGGWEATYTMAWLLAQPALEAGTETLPRVAADADRDAGHDRVIATSTPHDRSEQANTRSAIRVNSLTPDAPRGRALARPVRGLRRDDRAARVRHVAVRR
ncbi:MAG TPA: hypothetical protein VNA28_06900 [Solirubrobacteraceae bacterium]|nr:hypothetical protein [Solirubrobacteraceae bacterium]